MEVADGVAVGVVDGGAVAVSDRGHGGSGVAGADAGAVAGDADGAVGVDPAAGEVASVWMGRLAGPPRLRAAAQALAGVARPGRALWRRTVL